MGKWGSHSILLMYLWAILEAIVDVQIDCSIDDVTDFKNDFAFIEPPENPPATHITAFKDLFSPNQGSTNRPERVHWSWYGGFWNLKPYRSRNRAVRGSLTNDSTSFDSKMTRSERTWGKVDECPYRWTRIARPSSFHLQECSNELQNSHLKVKFTSAQPWFYHRSVRSPIEAQSKEGCVFPMVILSEFRLWQYRDDDHPEDALHFTVRISRTLFS